MMGRLTDYFCLVIITFMIHNEAHYVASNITLYFLKNAEIVFSINNIPPNS